MKHITSIYIAEHTPVTHREFILPLTGSFLMYKLDSKDK